MPLPSRRALLAGSLGASTFAPLLLSQSAASADVTVPDVSGVFFLNVDTIPGEATARGFANQIEVLDWAFGVSTSIAPTNTGAGASKSKPHDFVFVHRYDRASPLLFLAACTGKHLPKAVLTVQRAGETPFVYLTVTLSNLFVTSVTDALESGDGLPLEQVHLDYGGIALSYRTQNPDGSAGTTVKGQFDFIANKTT